MAVLDKSRLTPIRLIRVTLTRDTDTANKRGPEQIPSRPPMLAHCVMATQHRRRATCCGAKQRGNTTMEPEPSANCTILPSEWCKERRHQRGIDYREWSLAKELKQQRLHNIGPFGEREQDHGRRVRSELPFANSSI